MRTWRIGKQIGATGIATGIVTIAVAAMSLWTVRALQRVIDDAYDKDVKKQVLIGSAHADLRKMVAHEEAIVANVLQKNSEQYDAAVREDEIPLGDTGTYGAF